MNQDNLQKVQEFYLKRHHFPSYNELTKLLNYKTGAVISWVVYKWKRDGIVTEQEDKLIPTAKFFSLPFKAKDFRV